MGNEVIADIYDVTAGVALIIDLTRGRKPGGTSLCPPLPHVQGRQT